MLLTSAYLQTKLRLAIFLHVLTDNNEVDYPFLIVCPCPQIPFMHSKFLVMQHGCVTAFLHPWYIYIYCISIF